MMHSLKKLTALAALVAAGLAATSAGALDQRRYKQTDYKFPPREAEFDDDIERGFLSTILKHFNTAGVAQGSGNMDQARAEWASTAQGLADFCNKFPSTEYRVSFRYQAARLFIFAQQPEAAAEQAEKIQLDAAANKSSQAAASYLAAAGWLTASYAKVKAGTLEKLTLPSAEQRQGRPLAPRAPPGEWKRFVLAADAYAAQADADPDKDKPAGERVGGVPPAMLAAQAAQVQYAFDNMEDARARLEKVIQGWPGEAEIMAGAIPLYLQTFAVMKDEAGQAAALERVKAIVAEPAAKATEPKAKEAFARVQDLLARQEAAAAFGSAQRLLDAGKPAEAAAAFEKLAAASPGSPASALALNNAAVAHDKAGQADKAIALREQLVRESTDQRVVPGAMLALAGAHSKAGRHDAARGLYQDYLTRYPEGTFRCGAMQNVGIELDALQKPVEAARQYVTFGSDPKCASEDATGTARMLFRAGELLQKAGKKAEAKEAYGAAVKAGAASTDVVVKSQVAEATKRLKKL